MDLGNPHKVASHDDDLLPDNSEFSGCRKGTSVERSIYPSCIVEWWTWGDTILMDSAEHTCESRMGVIIEKRKRPGRDQSLRPPH